MSSVVETDRVNAIAMILTPRYLVSGILDTNITISVKSERKYKKNPSRTGMRTHTITFLHKD